MLISQSGTQLSNNGFKMNTFNFVTLANPSVPSSGFTYFTLNTRGTLLKLDFMYAGSVVTNFMPMITIDDIDYDLSAFSGATAYRSWENGSPTMLDSTTTSSRSLTINGPIRFRSLAIKARSLSTSIANANVTVNVIYGT